MTRQTAGFWLIAGSGSQERQQQCRSAPNRSLDVIGGVGGELAKFGGGAGRAGRS
jgi:hypothetical protein